MIRIIIEFFKRLFGITSDSEITEIIIKEETCMHKINVSEGKDHFSQRNNIIKPLGSCQVTSMVASLYYLGIQFGTGPYDQPEDNLRHFIEVVKGGNPENHEDLSRYTNEWVGRNVTKFSTIYSIDEIFNDIKNGKPVVMSGTFPGYPLPMNSPLQHVVSVVGLGWNSIQDMKYKPEIVTIDDPYGNTLDNWRGSGNDVDLTYDQFINWMKPVNITSFKWAHRFLV